MRGSLSGATGDAPDHESKRSCSASSASPQTPGEIALGASASAESLGAMLNSTPPLPPLVLVRSSTVCACSRRCTNKGHSRNSTTPCDSHDLVKGSQLCSICICILRPYCLRPRFNSIRCYGHESLFRKLSWPVQATHLLGEQGPL